MSKKIWDRMFHTAEWLGRWNIYLFLAAVALGSFLTHIQARFGLPELMAPTPECLEDHYKEQHADCLEDYAYLELDLENCPAELAECNRQYDNLTTWCRSVEWTLRAYRQKERETPE